MRTVGTKLVGLAAASLLLAVPAFASSASDDELAQMREAVKGLEQKVNAQQEQLEHQSGLLQDAQKAVREREQKEQSALSHMDEFWKAIDVNASVAGSYAYNFRNPTTSGSVGSSGVSQNTGVNGAFYPFHPDSNSFQVDQVWFDIGKKTTAESRAGFHTTILYGTTASFLGQGSPSGARFGTGDSTSDYYVHQAYVEYLAPLGEGLDFTFGKFATPIGAEVADASKNWAITRGDVYNLLEPIDHLGLMASTTFGPVTVAGAVVNQITSGSSSWSSPDFNTEKGYIGKIAFAPNQMFSLSTTVAYGADGVTVPGFNEQKVGILNVLASFTGDRFSAYANADYDWLEDTSLAKWGVSVAGKVSITDDLWSALRLEYVQDQSNALFLLGSHHSDIYGATGTLAYQLAENLTLKTEVRWDKVNESAGGFHEFFNSSSSDNPARHGTEDQVVGIAQVVYAF